MEKLITKFISYLDNLDVFMADQLPDFCKQLLEFSTFEHTLWMWVCLAIVIFLIIGGIIVILYESDACPIIIIFWILFLIPASICSVDNFVQLKKIEKAPKVYLLEKLNDFKS